MLEPGRSYSVTASAGSGKTHRLVSRVTRLLLEGAEPGGILAVTFTRKAAAEMRERVAARLRAMACADDATLDEVLSQLGLSPAPALRARARGLHEALLFAPFPPRALTLHAFCQDLLGRFALDGGLTPGFQLVEIEGPLFERAWQRLTRQLTASPDAPAAQALRQLAALGENEYTLRALVIEFLARRSDWWAFTESADDPVAFATAQLRRHLGDAAGSPWAALDAPSYTAHLRILFRWLEQTGGVGRLKPDALGPALAATGRARFEALRAALFKKDGDPQDLKISKGLRTKFSENELAHFEATHNEVLRVLLEALEHHARATTLARGAAALRLGAAALEALDAELRADHALTFADLEWRTCRLLQDPQQAEWIRYRLDRRIDHLLVDEFQDTSSTQWRLLKPILEEMAAGDAGRLRSAFIVGDPKQSIYGFRRANPELLQEATRYIQGSLRGETAELVESWRSAEAVIRFVNALFAPEELRLRIGFGDHTTRHRTLPGRVELLPLLPSRRPERAKAGPLRDPLVEPPPKAEAARDEEGRLVAARIEALVAAGVEITTRDGTPRALEYGDILVLARARTHLAALERAFVERGIPFIGAARGTLLTTAEGSDLQALLRFLNAPGRDLDLAHALRSPLFCAGDGLLARLAQDVKARGGSWFAALQRQAASEPELARAARLLAHWQELARRLPAHDLLDRICSEGDVAGRYEAALPPAERARVRANLGVLLQLALEADHGRYPTLTRFLDYLEGFAIETEEAPDEAPPPATAGQVRILTVHGAKGLEAPAVFLVNAGPMRAPNPPSWLVHWPHEEPRPAHFMLGGRADLRDAVSRRLIAAEQAREEREALNLLYVAVTRAQQYLFISGFQPLNTGSDPSWHDRALAALERLGAEPAAPLPGAVPGTMAYGLGNVRAGLPRRASDVPPAADAHYRRPLRAVTPAQREPVAIEPDAGAVRRGIAVHALLQQLVERPAGTDAELRATVEALAGVIDDAEFAQWLEEARGVVAAPALSRFFDPARVRRGWNEAPLVYAGPDGPVPGVMDRLVDDGESLWILDYKTQRKPQPAALAALYREQLQRYADGVAKLWPGRPVHAGLVLTATRAWVEMI